MTDDLLQKVKQNLILEHNEDDELLKMYITAAFSAPNASLNRSINKSSAALPEAE